MISLMTPQEKQRLARKRVSINMIILLVLGTFSIGCSETPQNPSPDVMPRGDLPEDSRPTSKTSSGLPALKGEAVGVASEISQIPVNKHSVEATEPKIKLDLEALKADLKASKAARDSAVAAVAIANENNGKTLAFMSSQAVMLDGVRIPVPVDLGFPDMRVNLPIPPGRHHFRESSDSRWERCDDAGFVDRYRIARQQMSDKAGLNFNRLAQAASNSRGLIDPIILLLLGDYYWKTDEPAAAIRFWKQAVLEWPMLGPAHLNLAFAFDARGDVELAWHQWHLAAAVNVQNAFGISPHLRSLADQLLRSNESIDQPLVQKTPFRIDDYRDVPLDQPKDREVVKMLQAFSTLVTTHEQRIACSNNIGVYLLRVADRPDTAVTHLATAYRDWLHAEERGQVERSDLRGALTKNLAEAANRAGFVEAGLYERIDRQP